MIGYLIKAAAVAAVLATPAYQYATKEQIQFTVTKAERVSDRYLIFTKDEVFENTDSVFQLKWNSSDYYAMAVTGVVCQASVYGWRVPILSQYRNIARMSCK